MNFLIGSVFTLFLASVIYSLNSIKIINEGSEALVERLGRYHKKLEPGLNFIFPIVEKVVVEESIREKVLGIDPEFAITKDNVSLQADAVIYWQIIDLEKTFYGIENIEEAIENMVVTTLRSAIGRLALEQTYSSRKTINQTLLQELDDATANWGVKVTRVEVREIKPAQTVMESLEQERAAESKKRAAVLETEGVVDSIKMISQALQQQPNTDAVLQFIVAQRYVEANEKLGASPNSKVVFMDPKALSEATTDLMSYRVDSFSNQRLNDNSNDSNLDQS